MAADDHRGERRRDRGEQRGSPRAIAVRWTRLRYVRGWPTRLPRTSTTFAARCSRPRPRRQSRPGSSSSARTVATASASRFPSPTSVPGLPRSSCCSAKDSAAPRRPRNRRPATDPRAKAEIEALGWEQLKALAVAYPETEYLPEESGSLVVQRWVGLTQADRDTLRAALDAADATPAEQTSPSSDSPELSRDLTSI